MSKIVKGIKSIFREGPAETARKIKSHYRKNEENRRHAEQLRKFHLITEEERLRQIGTNFTKAVKFSIITPLFNTPEVYLEELLKSLEKQTYANWELCLADGSDLKHAYVGEVCKKWAEKDARIIYKILQENKGISENTNECIRMSTGDYLGLLDHDDVLHESALFEMMAAIEKTGADFLYSDEAKFSGNIEDASDFNFKPGFGKDELRSHNYICHLTVFKRSLLDGEEVLYRSEFDGSQDHDMVLRLTEKAHKICHVPKVLYYWRVHPDSVSMNLDGKLYAVDSAIRAVSEQLVRCGELGVVESNLPYQTIYRIRYEIDKECKIGILVRGLESKEQFCKAKQRIAEKASYIDFDVYPVWKTSDETEGEALNKVIERIKCRFIILLDSQCTPKNAGWIEEMLMFAQREDVFAVGAKVLYENDTICCAGIAPGQSSSLKLHFLCEYASNKEQGYEAMLRLARNTTAVWGGCCMMEVKKLITLGGFEENMRGYEDIDICLRAVANGFWNVWTCFSEAVYSGQDCKAPYAEGDTEKFSLKWMGCLEAGDPYEHPALAELGLV